MFFESSGWRVASIAGIEISVSFWYLALMMFIIVFNGFPGGLLFALAITISVVIHEFGHAVPSKAYRLHPSILLHGFGGLCMHSPSDSDWKDILILVMGPLVEIAFGLAAFGLLTFVPMGGALHTFVFYFAWVSVIWGAVNLFIPLYPLDGGQLFHLFLRRFVDEHRAQDLALKTSITVAIPVGIGGIVYGWYFAAFLVFFIIMSNLNTLRSGQRLIRRKAKVRASSFVTDTLSEAEQAFTDEDWREAARLCHVIRAGSEPIPDKTMDRIWELLAVSTTRQGEWEEALGWIEQAPDTPAVARARRECEEHLEQEQG